MRAPENINYDENVYRVLPRNGRRGESQVGARVVSVINGTAKFRCFRGCTDPNPMLHTNTDRAAYTISHGDYRDLSFITGTCCDSFRDVVSIDSPSLGSWEL